MSMPNRRLEPLAQLVRARLGKHILLDGCWWATELDSTGPSAPGTPPPADCPAIAAVAVVHHDLADQWLEEEQPVYGMPKNPYHRVDALASGRHIRVFVNGELLATTGRLNPPDIHAEPSVVARSLG